MYYKAGSLPDRQDARVRHFSLGGMPPGNLSMNYFNLVRYQLPSSNYEWMWQLSQPASMPAD